MDFKQIQELIKIFTKSQISELSIEQEKFKITIKQKEPALVPQVVTLPPVAALAQAGTQVPPPHETTEKSRAETPRREEHLVAIKSPMIGTFYRSSSPDKPALVQVGDEIPTGKVVCIIEAMKLFNEIESEVSGRIVKVLVEDASPVEFDQPLFLVDPGISAEA